MVNVTIYSIHGSYVYCFIYQNLSSTGSILTSILGYAIVTPIDHRTPIEPSVVTDMRNHENGFNFFASTLDDVGCFQKPQGSTVARHLFLLCHSDVVPCCVLLAPICFSWSFSPRRIPHHNWIWVWSKYVKMITLKKWMSSHSSYTYHSVLLMFGQNHCWPYPGLGHSPSVSRPICTTQERNLWRSALSTNSFFRCQLGDTLYKVKNRQFNFLKEYGKPMRIMRFGGILFSNKPTWMF